MSTYLSLGDQPPFLMSKYSYETKMVPFDFSVVVERLPLTMMQADQHNKEIKRAEELITSVINKL